MKQYIKFNDTIDHKLYHFIPRKLSAGTGIRLVNNKL